jgi:hypothetical protein
MNVILTAGRATRLGALAPDGCKSLVELDGDPIIEWQMDALEDERPTIVCRTEHAARLSIYGPVVVDDSLAGPAHALYSVLAQLRYQDLEGDAITVVYADSFFTVLPDLPDFCGIQTVKGGRSWDLLSHDDEGWGNVTYHYISKHQWGTACVGLYRFSDHEKLARHLRSALYLNTRETGMAQVVNSYRPPFITIPSWQDAGDPSALANWKKPS